MTDGAGAARVLDILEAVLDLPERERDAWLQGAHGADPGLIAEVRRLLARDAQAGRRLPTRPPGADARSRPISVPDRVGPYRVVGRLGCGGMGVVYAAERDDGLFEHAVAIKFLPEAGESRLTERFAIERRALARLTHPNIARLLDGGVTADGVGYIIMERVEGRSLADHIAAEDCPDGETVRLFRQACLAVLDAHQRLVAHGDLKPSNILIRPDGEARVLDFGVARLMDDGAADGGSTPLTVDYASPERRAGAPPDVADDIFALGVMLGELLARRGPTLGGPAAPRPVQPDLAAISAKATEEPQQRYRSVSDLIDDLDRWSARKPVSARPASGAYRLNRLFARHPLASVAAVAAVVFLAGSSMAMTLLYMRAEAERREAEARFNDARDMARYMLFDLAENLGQSAGNLLVRRELIETSRAYLEELAGSAHASPGATAEAALGYVQLALLLGLQEGGNLGRPDESQAMLDRAQSLLRNPPESARADPLWLRAEGRLALAQSFQALILEDDVPRAERLLASAEQSLSAAVQLAPRDGEILADLWETRLLASDARAAAGDYAGARRLIETELLAWPSRQPLLRHVGRAPLLRARSLIQMGDAFYQEGAYTQAYSAYASSTDVLRAEDRARPGRPGAAALLIQALWSQGGAADALQDPTQGIALLEEARRRARARLAAEPVNDKLWRLAAIVEGDLAGMLARAGRSREALGLAEVLGEELREPERVGADEMTQRFALNLRRPLADARLESGDRPGACAEYRDLAVEWSRFAARFGVNAEVYRLERARVEAAASDCEA